MAALTEALDRTYHFPDTRVFLREYPSENVCQDGVVSAPIRPVAFLEAPELDSVDAKRSLVGALHKIIEHWYAGISDVEQTMTLVNQYPLHDVGWQGGLQSDNAMIVQAVAAMNS